VSCAEGRVPLWPTQNRAMSAASLSRVSHHSTLAIQPSRPRSPRRCSGWCLWNPGLAAQLPRARQCQSDSTFGPRFSAQPHARTVTREHAPVQRARHVPRRLSAPAQPPPLARECPSACRRRKHSQRPPSKPPTRELLGDPLQGPHRSRLITTQRHPVSTDRHVSRSCSGAAAPSRARAMRARAKVRVRA
jgi:hypothetical protein